MFIGHYGPAGLIHFLFRDVSFLWLMISTQLIDIAYFLSVMTCKIMCGMDVSSSCQYGWACLEYQTINVASMRQNKTFPTNSHTPYSHSLTGAIVLTMILTILYVVFHGKSKNRSIVSLYLVLFAGTASHWLLDVFVHRQDMAIFPPFTTTLLGYGTWENWSKWENFGLELVVNWIGIAFVFWLNKGRQNKSVWISSVIYLVLCSVLDWVAYFGTDYSKIADQVVDGAVSNPDQVPLILLTYVITFILSYIMEPAQDKSKSKDL